MASDGNIRLSNRPDNNPWHIGNSWSSVTFVNHTLCSFSWGKIVNFLQTRGFKAGFLHEGSFVSLWDKPAIWVENRVNEDSYQATKAVGTILINIVRTYMRYYVIPLWYSQLKSIHYHKKVSSHCITVGCMEQYISPSPSKLFAKLVLAFFEGNVCPFQDRAGLKAHWEYTSSGRYGIIASGKSMC